jgi:hypothetical protein
VTLAAGISGSGAVNIQNKSYVTFNGPVTGSETFTITDSPAAVMKTALTGTGQFYLANGANLEFGTADSENVTFLSGATGTLRIDHSLTAPFTGSLSGLTTKNAVNLVDLPFIGKMTASFSGTTAGGVLKVTNGNNQSVLLKLLGDYTTASWTLSNNGSGGTLVVDPPATGWHATKETDGLTADIQATSAGGTDSSDSCKDKLPGAHADPSGKEAPTSGLNSLGVHDFALSPAIMEGLSSFADSLAGGNSGGPVSGGPVSGGAAQNLALLAQYMASSFVTPSDGHGWTPTSDASQNQQPMLAHPHV